MKNFRTYVAAGALALNSLACDQSGEENPITVTPSYDAARCDTRAGHVPLKLNEKAVPVADFSAAGGGVIATVQGLRDICSKIVTDTVNYPEQRIACAQLQSDAHGVQSEVGEYSLSCTEIENTSDEDLEKNVSGSFKTGDGSTVWNNCVEIKYCATNK